MHILFLFLNVQCTLCANKAFLLKMLLKLVSGLKKANSVETHFRLAASSLQSQCSEDDDDSSDKPFDEDESGKHRFYQKERISKVT